MATTPLLTKLAEGELYLYLVISPIAVSSILIREEEDEQKLVYYTSKVLRCGDLVPKDGKGRLRSHDLGLMALTLLPGTLHHYLNKPALEVSPAKTRHLRKDCEVDSKAWRV